MASQLRNQPYPYQNDFNNVSILAQTFDKSGTGSDIFGTHHDIFGTFNDVSIFNIIRYVILI